MKEYQNYIFDLYGTLVDVHTDEGKDIFWKQLSFLFGMEDLRCSPEYLREKYHKQVQMLEAQARQKRGQWAEIDIAPVFSAIYQDLGRKAGSKRIAQTAKMFRLLSLEKLRLFPGALELLQRLKKAGKKIYLLSNAQSLFTMPELRALGLERYFDGIVISSDEGLKKPDDGLYRLTLARYGLDPARTVMVGNDDQADCWGAARAGLDSMYVATEQSPRRTEELPANCRLLETIADVFEAGK